MFLLSSIMLSSIVSVDVFNTVCVPLTSRSPVTTAEPLIVISPTDGSSTLPVSPSSVINVVVDPPSLTVKIISLSCVVFAMVKLSLDRLIVMSDPAPIVIPESFNTPKLPDVVSLALDLK